jgi:hypothetical protein
LEVNSEQILRFVSRASIGDRADDGEFHSRANEAGMDAWMTWMTNNKSALADMGAPLGKTKRVTAAGVSSVRNEVTGYTIVEAESHDAAAKMLTGHPHLSVPGAYIDVLSVTAIPGM